MAEKSEVVAPVETTEKEESTPVEKPTEKVEEKETPTEEKETPTEDKEKEEKSATDDKKKEAEDDKKEEKSEDKEVSDTNGHSESTNGHSEEPAVNGEAESDDWYNAECAKAIKDYKKAEQHYRRCPTEANKIARNKARSVRQRIIRNAQRKENEKRSVEEVEGKEATPVKKVKVDETTTTEAEPAKETA